MDEEDKWLEFVRYFDDIVDKEYLNFTNISHAQKFDYFFEGLKYLKNMFPCGEFSYSLAEDTFFVFVDEFELNITDKTITDFTYLIRCGFILNEDARYGLYVNM